MIHKFYLNDNYILLDVPSGSVHIVDEIVYDLIDDFKSTEEDYLIEKNKKKYSPENIKNAIKEIKVLVQEGLLFSEDTPINIDHYNSENIIKAMCLHVAHDCNLRCEYCFASQGDFKGQRTLMSFETGKAALDFIVKNSGHRKNIEVDFFGGEPLMNFEVVKQLVKYGRSIEKDYSKNFRFTITTNGMLLDSDKIDFINENMDNVVLSLDGRREINDNMRPTINNKGSYGVIVPKFKELIDKRGDKDYYIRGTFTNKNLDFSKDLIEFYELGFKKTSIEPVVTEPTMDYAIREEHLKTILEEYEKMSKDYLSIRKKDKDFLFFHFMVDLNQGPCLYKRSIGCGAGSEYIAVTPEGDIYPCHQFVGEMDFLLGNVFNGIENISMRDKFKNANVFTKDDCKSCWAKYYCSGGCHANAYYENKDLNSPYKNGCEMEKKRIECAISILAKESEN